MQDYLQNEIGWIPYLKSGIESVSLRGNKSAVFVEPTFLWGQLVLFYKKIYIANELFHRIHKPELYLYMFYLSWENKDNRSESFGVGAAH